VQDLAAIGPHDGLDVLRPTPPGLEGESPRDDLIDVDYVVLAVVEGPGLVGDSTLLVFSVSESAMP
jgi:hypothetical protein